MKKIVAVVGVLLMAAGMSFAADSTPVKLSLIPNVGIPAAQNVEILDLGLIATNIDNMKYVQLAWIYGGVKGTGEGVQIAFVVKANKFTGVQWGAVNLVGQMTGLQGGMINYADTMTGVQMCPLGLNKAKEMTGVQFGFFTVNSADKMKGLQLGAINYAGSLNGLQIGILNIHARGIPILPIVNFGF